MQGPPIWQRLLAALAYVLPWSDALGFGGSLMSQFPLLSWLALPTLPLQLLEQAVPFGGLVIFLLLFALVIRNPQVPYAIRFNVLQALLITILLVVVQLAFQIVLSSLAGGFVLRTLSNTVFLGTLLLVLYGIVESLRGREPEIPTVSEAVRMQLN
ncbi:MAG: Tic20 family protein [Cyanobium sp.]